MAQLSRTHSVPSEGLDLTLYFRQLTSSCNSSSKESTALFWHPLARHSCAQTIAHMYVCLTQSELHKITYSKRNIESNSFFLHYTCTK